MIYNFLVNDSFSCDGANVLTNDLVLAKKHLFNTVVWNLEEIVRKDNYFLHKYDVLSWESSWRFLRQ